MDWHGKRILVLGAGDTGRSVVDYLAGVGARVRVADSRRDPPGADEFRAKHPGVDLVTGSFTHSIFGDAELIVASPGVAGAGPACDPAIARAIAKGKDFVGDIELFAREQNEITGKKPKVIGITGSNGKSTVTAMAGAMCRAAGLKTVVAGNIGLPILDALRDAKASGEPDVYVIELSSFQLETTSSLHLDAATMLNLSQDHLDRYRSMKDYASAKQRIFMHAAHQVLNREDQASIQMRDAKLPRSTFGIDRAPGALDFGIDAGALCEGQTQLMPLADMPVAGLHNAANALAAFALCRAIGVDASMLADGLREFRGLPHRLENVGVINGVTFYDDSKGTNVGSTVAALDGMTVPVVLIAGGIGKEQDFSPLAEPVRKRARAVVLIGKDARSLESAITSARVGCIQATSMQDAVEKAFSAAVPGDAVLLSPACSSFDMFDNYKHRGDVFAACVRALKQNVEGGSKHAL
ncbi:MAG: UDP-N-acetylmuramoyl-L-alanine--D-glutamate ligase [Usitatibacteraceae bacterium]